MGYEGQKAALWSMREVLRPLTDAYGDARPGAISSG